MGEGETREEAVAAPREPDEDLPAVGSVAMPPDEPAGLHPVDELDRAMVSDVQAVGDLADRRTAVRGQAADGQEELMLPRLEPRPAGDLFAEPEEPSELVPEPGERAVFPVRERPGRHPVVISCPDMNASARDGDAVRIVPAAAGLPLAHPGRRFFRDWVPAHVTASQTAPSTRLQFLDACRALAVLAMLFANMMNVFLHRVPEVLSHNEGDRLRLFDFPAPMFQFLIGVSLVLFLQKRGVRGLRPLVAQGTAVRRFVLLILLGIALDCFGSLKSSPQWGVLQTLGLGGVAATLLAYLPDSIVGAVAVAVLVVFSGAFNGEVHHSPLAALAFVPLTLGGVLVGRGLATRAWRGAFERRAGLVVIGGLAVAAAARAAGIPFNKVLGTSSFVALASAVSAALLLGTAALELAGFEFPAWLLAVGSNALTAWVLQYLLVYYPAWLVFPAWRRLPMVPGILAAVVVLIVLSLITVRLGRRGIRIPI